MTPGMIAAGDWVKYATLHGDLAVFEVEHVSPDGLVLEGAEDTCHLARVIEVRHAERTS